jgi:hypothetical protein
MVHYCTINIQALLVSAESFKWAKLGNAGSFADGSAWPWRPQLHGTGDAGNAWNMKIDMAVCQNLVPLVNIKIAGKWMFIPLKMVLIGIDPYPHHSSHLSSRFHVNPCDMSILFHFWYADPPWTHYFFCRNVRDSACLWEKRAQLRQSHRGALQ